MAFLRDFNYCIAVKFVDHFLAAERLPSLRNACLGSQGSRLKAASAIFHF